MEPNEGRVAAVRRFNRFYTQRIGVLHEGLLNSPYSLTECRVLYELAHGDGPTAAELCRGLGLDGGYLSRILRGFSQRGLIDRQRSEADGRQRLLSLTRKGRASFAPLDARSRAEIRAMLHRLSPDDQGRLIQAMTTIERLLGTGSEGKVPYLLRSPQAGDMGWVAQRHGALYAQEYGYDEQFEGLVAGIVAAFLRTFDARRERCWIAEREGQNVGSVFLVRKSKTVARLRLLLVEPAARGLGIGSRLVDECIRFARRAGYGTITLWTQSELHAARRTYERAGFRLVAQEPHHSFGKDLVGETWELGLRDA